METTTATPRTYALLTLYDMHTDFFPRALEGIKDSDAHNRLNTKANHVAWLTGSLVQQRFELAKDLGIERKQSAYELFCDNKGIQDDVIYPSLEQFKIDWKLITPILRKAMAGATDTQLDRTIAMPGMNMSFYELISFITYREANCIGQIALWRRLLGYSAMNYM
ncbi:DinB family protein [Segetibacter sp. 3557_3]|uniref:DinB family protein n=1 Tax=Segetibacter sp. 3557_3 TaxID=2547429 RepID=UPI00105869DF|nr:DinB family protein [Segetibacter sp. 3557_3]TDH21263.1 DinB family protein [Segetibacter sp. 3557_3]